MVGKCAPGEENPPAGAGGSGGVAPHFSLIGARKTSLAALRLSHGAAAGCNPACGAGARRPDPVTISA